MHFAIFLEGDESEADTFDSQGEARRRRRGQQWGWRCAEWTDDKDYWERKSTGRRCDG